MNLKSALLEWEAILGDDGVLSENIAIAAYINDTSAQERKISAILKVKDSELIPSIINIACKYDIAVYPISTGNNWGYGTSLPVKDNNVIIDLSGVNKILHFDEDFGVVTLEPGVTQQMLCDFLEKGNYPYMVPVTGAGPTCSLLANALERGYGVTPHSDHFGAITSLQAVLADGSVYKTALTESGGEDISRLFKWGIGPYSVGLFSQSGFGVVTQMTIVLAPRPSSIKVCLFSIKDDKSLEQVITKIQNMMKSFPSIIGGINLMNQHRVLSMIAPFSFDKLNENGIMSEQTIKDLGEKYKVYPWTGFITLYGHKKVVQVVQSQIKTQLKSIACKIMFVTPKQANFLSKAVQMLPKKIGANFIALTQALSKSLELVSGYPNETTLPLAYWKNKSKKISTPRNPAKDGCGLIWYAPLVPMRPQAIRKYVDMVKDITSQYAIEPLITFTTLNDRLFDSTVPIIFDKDDKEATKKAQDCYLKLLSVGRENGWFPYRVGVGYMDKIEQMQPVSSQFHKKLKKSIDPKNIISPGRYE